MLALDIPDDDMPDSAFAKAIIERDGFKCWE